MLPSMKKNKDGSLTIYIPKDAPRAHKKATGGRLVMDINGDVFPGEADNSGKNSCGQPTSLETRVK
jgi:hypothetical protein